MASCPRVKCTKWSPPFTPGHDCRPDEFLPRYLHFVADKLGDELCELMGQTLVFDTSPDMPSAADVLAGLVFEMLAPDPHLRKLLPRKRGTTAKSSSSGRAGIIPKALGLAVAPLADAAQVFTGYLSQEASALAVPGCMVSSLPWWRISSMQPRLTFFVDGSSLKS